MEDHDNSMRKKSIPKNPEYLTLHEQYKIIGDALTNKDVTVLRCIYTTTLGEDVTSKVTDGNSFILAMERAGKVDETNYRNLFQMLELLTRHDLLHYLCCRKRRPASPDPVEEYIKNVEKNTEFRKRRAFNPFKDESDKLDDKSQPSTSDGTDGVKKQKTDEYIVKTVAIEPSYDMPIGPKDKLECDIHMRVRAQYCQHDTALQGSVVSHKPDLMERQMDKFMQAHNILKSRDLGCIVCKITFSEVTYLDAFWRDYLDGSLVEALKKVFITEALEQRIGNEEIKLLVSLDERDYCNARKLLAENL